MGKKERERWGDRVREMRGMRERERDSGQAHLVVSIPMHACISVNVAGNRTISNVPEMGKVLTG